MNNPIRIGLVGLGRAGWGMHCEELDRLKDKFKIAAVCDILPERREKAAARYGCKAYDNIAELIADPEVEIVDIATRSVSHFEHAKAALLAGKNVNLEKPMTVNYQQACALKELVSKPGSPKLYIRHNRRFEPAFKQIKAIVDSGKLGEVYEICLARHDFDWRDDWQTLDEFGGGQLRNWGPHIIDHALRFLDDDVDKIFCDTKNIGSFGDREDHLKIVLKAKTGRIVDLEISGGVAINAPVYHIYGTNGTLISDERTIKMKYLDPSMIRPDKKSDSGTPGTTFGTPVEFKWIDEEIPVINTSMSDDIWTALYENFRNGKEYPISLDQALHVMQIVTYVYENGGLKNYRG